VISALLTALLLAQAEAPVNNPNGTMYSARFCFDAGCTKTLQLSGGALVANARIGATDFSATNASGSTAFQALRNTKWCMNSDFSCTAYWQYDTNSNLIFNDGLPALLLHNTADNKYGYVRVYSSFLQIGGNGQGSEVDHIEIGPGALGVGQLEVTATEVRVFDGLKFYMGSTGTGFAASYALTSTIDVASVAANSCLDTSVTVTGAVAGSICAVGAPAAALAGVDFTCYVSATNTVQLRTCNPTTSAKDPASGSYQVRVFNP
jgi:hypothetical protein